jgi:hypothetical protein
LRAFVDFVVPLREQLVRAAIQALQHLAGALNVRRPF